MDIVCNLRQSFGRSLIGVDRQEFEQDETIFAVNPSWPGIVITDEPSPNVIIPNYKPTPDYKCFGCGIAGVKLWRLYMSSSVILRCAVCACENQGVANDIGDDGRREDVCGQTDKIGNLIPAVPDNDGEYWGYFEVPYMWAQWWRSLPTRKAG